VVAGGNLYVINEEGTATVLALGGKPRVLAVNALGETVLATPAVAGGALYLRSDHFLYCVAEKKGK
jgi:hypothetical protein